MDPLSMERSDSVSQIRALMEKLAVKEADRSTATPLTAQEETDGAEGTDSIRHSREVQELLKKLEDEQAAQAGGDEQKAEADNTAREAKKHRKRHQHKKADTGGMAAGQDGTAPPRMKKPDGVTGASKKH